MPSTAQRPYLVEAPAKQSPLMPAQKSFDPLLVLRAAVTQDEQQQATPAAAASSGLTPARMIRRRGSIQQGRALEMLGHAVEYLIDSRMFELHEATREPEAEAVQILMKLSRSVFSDCPEVISLRTRVARLLRFDRSV